MLQLVTATSLEDRRMSLLIRQLREEGHSQTEIARMLGISQSMVSAVGLGTRQVGLKVIRSVQARMKIASAFFTDATLGDRPHYKDFSDARGDVRRAVERWLATMPPGLVESRDVELLSETLPGGVPLSDRTIQSWWQDILDDRRRGRDVIEPPPTREGVRKIADVDAERARKRSSVRGGR